MDKEIRVLILEDVSTDAELMQCELKKSGMVFRTEWVKNQEGFSRALKEFDPDIILSDYNLPGFDGFAALIQAKLRSPFVPFIFVTGAIGEERAIETLKSGATDYVLKDRLYRLAPKVIRALKDVEEGRERRELENQYQSLLENTNQGIMLMSLDYRVMKANKVVTGWLNMSLQALKGKECFRVCERREEKCPNCLGQIAIANGHSVTAERKMAQAEGKVFLINAVPMFDQEHKVTGFMEVIEDITERKKSEEALKVAMAVKTQFTVMVSHELRTPLGSIKEGASILLDGLSGEISAKQREILTIVKGSADRLHRLINNVLDFQKMDSGSMPFDMRENAMDDVVKEVASTMALVAKQNKLELTVEYAEGIPRIRFDRDKIIQVLTNLVNNAIKFTDQGTIKIKTWAQGNTVCVTVKDTGPGISPENLPTLFKSFHQLHNLNDRKTGGTGLGLAISKEIITRHNGKIWAESELGKGSIFYFLLPIEDRRVKDV